MNQWLFTITFESPGPNVGDIPTTKLYEMSITAPNFKSAYTYALQEETPNYKIVSVQRKDYIQGNSIDFTKTTPVP